jgi:hypothetical protein
MKLMKKSLLVKLPQGLAPLVANLVVAQAEGR